MSLRLQFIFTFVLLHAVLIGLAWQLRSINVYLFVGAEAFLAVSIVLCVRLYTGFVQPFHLIAAGTAAIRSKDFSMKFVPVGQPDMDRLIEVYNVMIDELRQERISQHEKSFLLERLIEASPAGILILDFEGRIDSTNAAAARFVGLPEAALARQWPAALPGEWGATLAALPEGQTRTLRPAGLPTYRVQASHFLDRGFTRRFLIVEELTQELMQQEKAAYEKLIRMMSHEINNSIGAINSILGSFRHYTPQLDPDDQPDFQQALDVSVARNTQLANFIGNFAHLVRLPPPTFQPTDLHALLRSICRLLQPQSEQRRIQWHLAFGPEPLVVRLDQQQLEQAFLNIAKNALEAIDHDGNVWVRTTVHPLTVEIENDGPRLAPEVSPRLFTPFFSTKRDGQGIGLTLVRDILLAHGFAFRLEPGATAGAVFTVEMAA
jgi:two-component system nitrogen regulation sensor histidine kinase NtrY